MVGTGTGIAPFMSMIRQLDHDALMGRTHQVRYTLIYADRTLRQLAYHAELVDIEAAKRLDFVYIPSVSRPTAADGADARLGRGRANNLLRHVFGMPLMVDAVGHAVGPALPAHVRRNRLSERFDKAKTVILTCGNPASVEDIRLVADAQRIRIETEDW